MDWQDTTIDRTLSGLWVCPHCAARLIGRNLWHSCWQFTLEALFAKAEPAALDLARQYVGMLHSLGDVQVIPQKTRLVCVARVRFAGLSPRKDGFLASFALHRWLDSRRIVKTAETDVKLDDIKPNDQVTIVGTTDSAGLVSASAVVVGGVNVLGQLFGSQTGVPGGARPGATPTSSPRP